MTIFISSDTVNQEDREYNQQKHYKIYTKSLNVQGVYLFAHFHIEHIEVVSFLKGLQY